MSTLTKATEIITLESMPEDRRLAAEYAARTLPWTFNRMSKKVSARGQNDRGLNIAKGIVAQEVLRRELGRRGVTVELQRKSHRDEDLFDFHIRQNGALKKFDVKSIAFYNDYVVVGRPAFSKQLIIDNKAYPGPDWRHFFPMMMAHTQIGQPKEAYIFAISESPDFRHKVLEGRSEHMIVAYPNGEAMRFFSSKKLCLARESAQKGFYIAVEYEAGDLFSQGRELCVEILYEWAGNKKREKLTVKPGSKARLVSPMSVLNCISLSLAQYKVFSGLLTIKVAKNEFKGVVLNSNMEDINEVPNDALIYAPDDFCNVMLPDSFKLHYVGWITKEAFLEACKKYPAYVWPIDKVDRFANSPWSQITERDARLVKSLGMEDRITKKPVQINIGLMKTSGFGQGACCYVFPNIFGTGVRETNIYVLPQDLQALNSLTSAKVQTIGV